MKFCMITTFFGAQSFGGDAVYVERLSRALLRRGHEVTVIHCADAFKAVRGSHPGRTYTPPDGLRVHTLRSRLGRLSPLLSHQTGGPGPKRRAILDVLCGEAFDVVHFHNVSLIGGPRILELAGRGGHAVKLMTSHEHWLVCPLNLLWKYDRQPCERPQCLGCVLSARRPPQVWRSTDALERALTHLDALVYPSRHALQAHRDRGIRAPAAHLPYFLPEDWAEPADGSPRIERPSLTQQARPYFAAVGRLVKEKGFQQVIPLMAHFPGLHLRIAGAGPFEWELRRLARGLPNVYFLGVLDFPSLAALYRDARALIVPSLFYETFGYVVLEAFSVGTPAIVRRRGALPELLEASGGGIVYDVEDELEAAMRSLATDEPLRDALGAAGARAVAARWSEESHVTQYLDLIERARAKKNPLDLVI